VAVTPLGSITEKSIGNVALRTLAVTVAPPPVPGAVKTTPLPPPDKLPAVAVHAAPTGGAGLKYTETFSPTPSVVLSRFGFPGGVHDTCDVNRYFPTPTPLV
jgi:hypothetical protein